MLFSRRPARVVGLAVALMIAPPGRPADAQPEADADLRAQVEALRAELDELKAERHETWMTERRAEEVRALVREVLADAEARGRFAPGPITAGHDGRGFYLSSQDGAFVLWIGGQLQVRYLYNQRDDSAGSGENAGDDHVAGFQLRRMKLTFSGHVADPRLKYKVVLAANRGAEDFPSPRDDSGGEIELDDDAYLTYDLTDTLTVGLGQRKLPFLRQELLSSTRQLAVERGLVTEAFTLNRSQGVWLEWMPSDDLDLAVMLSDGADAAATDFHEDAADFAVTARADVRVAGQWDQARDPMAWDGEPLGVFVGGAVHYEAAESGSAVAAPVESFLAWTADALVEVRRLSVLAAVKGQHVDNDPGATLDHLGALIEAGYFVVPDVVQPFVRVEWMDFDGLAIQPDSVVAVTGGFNWFQRKHAAKFTADIVYLFDPLDGTQPSAASSTGLGLLEDSPGNKSQFAVRAQYQLLF